MSTLFMLNSYCTMQLFSQSSVIQFCATHSHCNHALLLLVEWHQVWSSAVVAHLPQSLTYCAFANTLHKLVVLFKFII